MKKIGLSLILFVSQFAYGHCPIEMSLNSEDFCFSVNWIKGEKKRQGTFEETNVLSPYLIPRAEKVPQKWVYSKAEVFIWKKGDPSHAPQQIEGLNIFPYMHMQNGHHHGASYAFSWNDEGQRYELSKVAFREMPGCWSLRWKLQTERGAGHSGFLAYIGNYSNLDEGQNVERENICRTLGEDQDDDDHDGGHGDHHHH